MSDQFDARSGEPTGVAHAVPVHRIPALMSGVVVDHATFALQVVGFRASDSVIDAQGGITAHRRHHRLGWAAW
jgi:hypothetical protein